MFPGATAAHAVLDQNDDIALSIVGSFREIRLLDPVGTLLWATPLPAGTGSVTPTSVLPSNAVCLASYGPSLVTCYAN